MRAGNKILIFRWIVILISFITLTYTSAVFAANAKNIADCLVKAGMRYKINPMLLEAIAEQESSNNPAAINRNRNGTYDIGIMQINSSWLTQLKEFGINRQSLFEPCTNINVGAWILAQKIEQYGNNWGAVGSYNAGAPTTNDKKRIREEYAQKVYSRYTAIISSGMRDNTRH